MEPLPCSPVPQQPLLAMWLYIALVELPLGPVTVCTWFHMYWPMVLGLGAEPELESIW